MATPVLSFGFLASFKVVFIFLFVFTLFYAVLSKTKILGPNKGIHFLISFSVAMLFMFAANPLEFVDLVIPWLGVLLIVFMCFMILFMFIGVKGETIVGAISEPGITWTIVITLLVLLVIALTKVFGAQVASLTSDLPEDSQDNFLGGVGEIVFSTKVLGMFLIILIAAMATKALGGAT